MGTFPVKFICICTFISWFWGSCPGDCTAGMSFRQDPPVNKNVVETGKVKEVRITTAIISGKVNANVTMKIDKRGICWNTDGHPTIEDQKVLAGKGTGSFTASLKGLKKGTVYHARAFAGNEDHMFYGTPVYFTTHIFANGVQVDIIYVEGGSFDMGAGKAQEDYYDDEIPVHKVMLSGFQISSYEITSRQYCAFLNDRNISSAGEYRDKLYIDMADPDCPVRFSGRRFIPQTGKGDHPVTEVTWSGAQAFCQWLGGRLPTEAEWEFAARGGVKSRDYRYSGSNNLDQVGWYKNNSDSHSHPVGQKSPNILGLYDMSGNVWEWCFDWYAFDYYADSPKKNPAGPSDGSMRVLRGGAWNMGEWNCRVSNRSNKSPQITYNYFGFRLLIPSPSD